MNEQTITATYGALKLYQHLEMKAWGTPGASAPYWERQARYQYDEVVATAWDFTDPHGDEFEKEGHWDDEDEMTASITMPQPREGR